MSQRLLIVGASVRPWISSARRAGFQVCAYDFFADWDARFWCAQEIQNRNQNPGGAIERIERFEDVFESQQWQTCDAALICGGFENRGDLIRRVAHRMPILGTGPDQLKEIARPIELFGRLHEAGFAVPETCSDFSQDMNHRDWLQKSATSSSGLGVQAIDSQQRVPPSGANLFFQQRVQGDSVSAIFVSMDPADGTGYTTRLLAISRQLVGDQAFGAAEFRYCGLIGPIQVSSDDSREIERIGRFVGREYGITGLWGIDFIVNQNGVWPVDINPRVTASAELLEALILNSNSSLTGIVDIMAQVSIGQTNIEAFSEKLDGVGFAEKAPPFIEGKAILFNHGSMPISITSRLFSELRSRFDDRFFATSNLGFSIADVPYPAQIIPVGCPILTIRVRCREADEAMRELRQKAGQLFGDLGILT